MMKQHIFPAIRLTFVCIVAFCGFYTLLILGIAQAAPGKGEGTKVIKDGKIVGYALEGQSFTANKYFNSRPSAVGYNAASSAGSNKGPTNPDYLKIVSDRIDTLLKHNPTISKADIPADLVTASGSGLDPDISLKSALIQVDRIAKERNIAKETILKLINEQKEQSMFNGIEKINTLQLNIALDKIQ